MVVLLISSQINELCKFVVGLLRDDAVDVLTELRDIVIVGISNRSSGSAITVVAQISSHLAISLASSGLDEPVLKDDSLVLGGVVIVGKLEVVGAEVRHGHLVLLLSLILVDVSGRNNIAGGTSGTDPNNGLCSSILSRDACLAVIQGRSHAGVLHGLARRRVLDITHAVVIIPLRELAIAILLDNSLLDLEILRTITTRPDHNES